MRQEKILTAIEVMQDALNSINHISDRISRLEIEIMYLAEKVEADAFKRAFYDGKEDA